MNKLASEMAKIYSCSTKKQTKKLAKLLNHWTLLRNFVFDPSHKSGSALTKSRRFTQISYKVHYFDVFGKGSCSWDFGVGPKYFS